MKSTPIRGVKQFLKPCVYKLWEHEATAVRPGAFCIMSLRVALCGELKPRGVGVGKPSPNRALVAWCRPETGRSIHGQGEVEVTRDGGPNPLTLKSQGMTCGLE